MCWDQWYPEGARLASLQGATVLFYPTAIAWHPAEKAQYGAAQLDAWQTIQRAHAIANGVYVCAVNRIGFEGTPDKGLEFWGSSFVADPFGQVIAAGIDRQGRGAGGRSRSEAAGRGPAQLAVPPRPPHRRLWGVDESLDRIMASPGPGSRFRMPAEWEAHEGTWIAWPHEESDWPGKFEPVHWVYGEFVRH